MEEVKKEEGYSIAFEDLMLIASGELEDGGPSSVATIAIDKLNENGEQVPDQEVVMQNAVLMFYMSGGCLVIQADFSSRGSYEYKRALEALSEYSNGISNPEYAKTHDMAVIAVPMVLQGQITVAMKDLVYFTGFDLPNFERRLIMCFNNLETEVFDTSGSVDYEELEAKVQSEIRREEERLQAEIDATYAEIEVEKAKNPYADKVQEDYASNADDLMDEKVTDDGGSSWFRTSK